MTALSFIRNSKPLFIIIYLACMGMACVFSATHYMGGTPSPLVGLTFMGFVFFIYMINRFTDVREDFANNATKAVFFNNHKTLIKVAISAAVLSVIALTAANKLSLFHIVLVGTGILYSYRLIPWYQKGKGFTYFRIKELPLVKNLVVAFLWALSIFLIPIFLLDISISNPIIIGFLIAAVAVSTFNNTLFNDIMDIIGDKISGTPTLPALFGNSVSYRVLYSLNACWLTAVVAIFLIGMIDIKHFIFLLTLSLYPLTYISGYARGWLKSGSVEFLMEMDLIIIACGLALLGSGF